MYGEIISDAASHGLSRLIALDRHPKHVSKRVSRPYLNEAKIAGQRPIRHMGMGLKVRAQAAWLDVARRLA